MRSFLLILTLFLFSQSNAQNILEITTSGNPIVGKPLTITVNAVHNKPINRLVLLKDTDYANQIKQDCGGSQTCQLTTELTLPYEGTVHLTAYLWIYPNSVDNYIEVDLTFTCEGGYCEPDPAVSAFIQWMRQAKYEECVIEKYYTFLKDSELRAGMKDFILSSGEILSKNMAVDFYDIIPTDANSTYKEMSTDKAELCVPSALWPEFCPTPVPADYKFVEKHFNKVFGVNITLTYKQQFINYKNQFGDLVWNPSIGWEFPFQKLNAFEVNFPKRSIVHYAMTSLDGMTLGPASKGTFVARMFQNVKSYLDIQIYSHEWGHAQGLPHTFLGQNPNLVSFSLDGILNNHYVPSTAMYDPMDPLERYALQPTNGYVDQSTFGPTYSEGIIPTYHMMNNCMVADPSIKSLKLVGQDGIKSSFRIITENIGPLDCGFVNLSLNLNSSNGPQIANYIIENMDSGLPDTLTVEINNNLLDGNSLYATLDPSLEMTELDESNNTLFTLLNALENPNDLLEFSVFPNPGNGVFHINNPSGKNYQGTVYNIHGQVIWKDQLEKELILPSAQDGMYMLEVKNPLTEQRTYIKLITLD